MGPVEEYLAQLLFGERLQHSGDVVHAGALAKDAGEPAFLVAVKGAAGGRLGVLVDAQALKAAGIEPESMGVAGVHGHRSIGEERIERQAGGWDGRIPQHVAPAMGKRPGAIRLVFGKVIHVLGAVCLRGAAVLHGPSRWIERRMEHMLMCIMEAGADEGVLKVFYQGVFCNVGIHLLRWHHRRDDVSLYDHRGRIAAIVSAVEHVARRDNPRCHGLNLPWMKPALAEDTTLH